MFHRPCSLMTEAAETSTHGKPALASASAFAPETGLLTTTSTAVVGSPFCSRTMSGRRWPTGCSGATAFHIVGHCNSTGMPHARPPLDPEHGKEIRIELLFPSSMHRWAIAFTWSAVSVDVATAQLCCIAW